MSAVNQIDGQVHTQAVRIPAHKIMLDGDLTVPANARGLVVFVDGGGLSRKNPQNSFAACHLNGHGLASLLVDLLIPGEEEIDRKHHQLGSNLALLADRMEHVTKWVKTDSRTNGLEIGYFSTGAGAAAALVAAARHPQSVNAIVSRGGRPDLANGFLSLLKAPTLLIAGTHDPEILHLNRESLSELNKDSAIRLVSGASHLFEEPGALEQVTELAATWFGTHIG